MQDQQIIESVRHWVDTLIVGMNLCPFAKRELVKERVRFLVSPATDEAQLLAILTVELERLNRDPAIETTLLIHPQALTDFYDFNQFLNQADDLLIEMGMEGIFQIASFHPDYQFGGTEPDDAENYTNRSPFPVLHLLREASLERAIANYPDVDKIPDHNIALMESLGTDKLKAIMHSCLHRPA
ncbi:MAG: DUF1415 domain-containing protein [Motiliproteus sp.]